MNIDQAKRVRELIASVYDQSRTATQCDVNNMLGNCTIGDNGIRKERIIRGTLFELMELFPEDKEKLPCDEPDY